MTFFQLLMLGASAFFAYKIYEHIQTLQDPEEGISADETVPREKEAFSPFEAQELIQRGDEARENEDLDRALAIYSEANIKQPNDAETLFKMGYTLALQNRDEEALEYFFDSLKVDDANPFAYLEIAKIYDKMGDAQKAAEYQEKGEALRENL